MAFRGTCPSGAHKDIREDWARGTRVCRACGIVLAEKMIDRANELRTFGDSDSNALSRTNGINSETRTMDMCFGDKRLDNYGMRSQGPSATSGYDETKLKRGKNRIQLLCEKLKLVPRIEEAARGHFKLMNTVDLKHKGISFDARVALCILMACRENKELPSYEKLCKKSNIQMIDLQKAKKNIIKLAEKNPNLKVFQDLLSSAKADELVVNWIPKLGLKSPEKLIRMAKKIAEWILKTNMLGSPTFEKIAAGIILALSERVNSESVDMNILNRLTKIQLDTMNKGKQDVLKLIDKRIIHLDVEGGDVSFEGGV